MVRLRQPHRVVRCCPNTTVLRAKVASLLASRISRSGAQIFPGTLHIRRCFARVQRVERKIFSPKSTERSCAACFVRTCGTALHGRDTPPCSPVEGGAPAAFPSGARRASRSRPADLPFVLPLFACDKPTKPQQNCQRRVTLPFVLQKKWILGSLSMRTHSLLDALLTGLTCLVTPKPNRSCMKRTFSPS